MSKVLVIGCGGVASVAISKCCQVSDVFTELCIATIEVNKHADCTTHVDVACNLAIFYSITSETANCYLFADACDRLCHKVRYFLAIELAVVEVIKILRINICNLLCNLVCNSMEIIRSGNEVGLAVYFNHRNDLSIIASIYSHNALSCYTACLFLSLSDSLLAKEVYCLFLITISSRECLLAVHHACSRLFTELLDHSSSNFCHIIFLP